MATYCISDLHGRYDLFMMLLEKIEFDHKKDVLYLLGDAIDGAYGGIKIIQYFMVHEDSCKLIKGNHEAYFIKSIPIYDVIMSDSKLRESIIEIGKHPTIFKQVYDMYSPSKSLSHLLASKDVYKWSKQGNVKQRKKLLDSLDLFRNIDIPSREFMNFVRSMNKYFETREFVNELATLTDSEYEQIKAFLNCIPDTADIVVNEKKFSLLHSIDDKNKHYMVWNILKQRETHGIHYIYGHEPVPKLHRTLQNINFDFNFRTIFSYVDQNNNFYYNLDLGSNPVAALRLDDLSEFYVGIPPQRDDKNNWIVPDDITCSPLNRYEKYEYPLKFGKYSFEKHTKSRYVITTFVGNSYEFLIAIDKTHNHIFYTRISWIPHYFAIDDINIEQSSTNDIIAIVQKRASIDLLNISKDDLYGKNWR